MVKKQCLGFIHTPPLWVNEQFGIQQFRFPELDFTNFSPTPIPGKIRLGHQMEHVFKQLIEYSPDYEVILHNLPVRREKQTLGEIDFILQEVTTQKLIHVELTYKFYIIDPKISEPINRVIGPNKHDAFFAKTEKIKNKQFQLLHTKEGAITLAKNNIKHSDISHQACFKGQLFTPYSAKTTDLYPLEQRCIYGFWLYFDDFNSAEFKPYQFYIPFKSEWVIAPHTDVLWTSHSETSKELHLQMYKERAPMVWIKKSETEFEKFFVVWWK